MFPLLPRGDPLKTVNLTRHLRDRIKCQFGKGQRALKVERRPPVDSRDDPDVLVIHIGALFQQQTHQRVLVVPGQVVRLALIHHGIW